MKELAEKFIEHCKDNNLEGVRDCLSRGVDVNTVSGGGRFSGLRIAVDKNYPELLEILLSHPQIKINKPTDALGIKLSGQQFTALMFACFRGSDDDEIVSKLVKALVYILGLTTGAPNKLKWFPCKA